MFAELKSSDLKRISGISFDTPSLRQAPPRVLRLKTGQMLFHQGDSARTIFRVESGVLRLRRVTESGQQQVISFAYPGDVLGFPLAGRRTTECDALTEAGLSVIPTGTSEGTVNPDRLAYLAAAALAEIGRTQDHLMTLGRTTSLEKVAAFLVHIGERAGEASCGSIRFDLPMSRSDIAEFLGLRTETVSRAFTELRKAGLIELGSAQEVTIRDVSGLRDIAEAE